MILNALMDFARSQGLTENPDYQPMPVRWLIHIDSGGKPLIVRDTLTPTSEGDGKPAAAVFLIPKRSKRTSAVSTEFVVDKAAYVFGWVHPDKLADKNLSDAKKEQLRARAAKGHDLYLNELRLIGNVTADEGVSAWLAFLTGPAVQSLQLPDWGEGDLIAPCYYPDGGPLLSDRLSDYWKGRRLEPQFGSGEPCGPADRTADTPVTCLVTGEPCAPVRLHPSVKGIPPVSDTKGGVPLTSINAPSFGSYRLEDVGCAPVSQAAADAYQTALNRLLADAYPHPTVQGTTLPPRKVKLADDTAVVFWSKNDEAVDTLWGAIESADPNAVEALYSAVWKGKPIALDDPTPFFALTLSGAQGRGTVRGWHESNLAAVIQHVKSYLKQLEIARPPQSGTHPPLLALLRQTAVFGKLENIPPGLAGEVFQAVLTGRPFPHSVLDALVRRLRAERELLPDRAAFLKAYLCRINLLKEDNRMLDDDCPDHSYRLGRLFAVLEKLQEEAISANASIRDRYYGAASATPVVVFPQLLRKVPHHLSKLTPGRRTNLDKLIQQVCSGLPSEAPFPPTMTLQEQGLFAVGYYHQRQALFTKKDATDPEPDTTPEN